MNIATILFVFNRPEHTKHVLQGLRENGITKLYVFIDAPRFKEEEVEVEKVKQLIQEIDWCETEVECKTKNEGLAESIIKGVSSIFQKGYEGVIVLEDDCVPKKDFMNFMYQALNYYKDDSKVMHISGFGLPIKKYSDKDVYFTPYPCSWGWATWAKDWNDCDFYNDSEYGKLLMDAERKKEFNYAGEAFAEFLEFQLKGKVNSWLIRWYFHIFSKKGRCVWSYRTLVNNKGFDGTGVHKNKIDRFNQRDSVDDESKVNFNFENDLKYNHKLIREFRRHFMGKSYKERLKTVLYLTTGVIVGK